MNGEDVALRVVIGAAGDEHCADAGETGEQAVGIGNGRVIDNEDADVLLRNRADDLALAPNDKLLVLDRKIGRSAGYLDGAFDHGSLSRRLFIGAGGEPFNLFPVAGPLPAD